MNSGRLSVAGTPLGNLGDISPRLIQVLKEADFVLAEDTRVSKKLLPLDSQARLIAFHEHTSEKIYLDILTWIKEGKKIVLLSDAGTPGVADPGGKLLDAVWQEYKDGQLQLEVIPGPSAVTSALSMCGFYVNNFEFLGFLPKKKGRQTLFKAIAATDNSFVFFESPYRIYKTIQELAKYCNLERRFFVGREMTKQFEQYWRGTFNEINDFVANVPAKGEFTVVIDRESKEIRNEN